MFCASVRYFLYGVSVPLPQRSLGAPRVAETLKEVLLLFWGWGGGSPSVFHPWARLVLSLVSVGGIFPSDSCCISPSFHPRGDLGEEEEEEFLLWRAPFFGEGLVYGRSCWLCGVEWSVSGSWALCALNDRRNAIQFWTELLNGNGTCWAAISLHCHSHRVRLGLWSSVCVVLYPINLYKNAWSSLVVMWWWYPAVMLSRNNAAHQLPLPHAQPPTEGLSPSLTHSPADAAVQCLARHGFL